MWEDVCTLFSRFRFFCQFAVQSISDLHVPSSPSWQQPFPTLAWLAGKRRQRVRNKSAVLSRRLSLLFKSVQPILESTYCYKPFGETIAVVTQRYTINNSVTRSLCGHPSYYVQMFEAIV